MAICIARSIKFTYIVFLIDLSEIKVAGQIEEVYGTTESAKKCSPTLKQV